MHKCCLRSRKHRPIKINRGFVTWARIKWVHDSRTISSTTMDYEIWNCPFLSLSRHQLVVVAVCGGSALFSPVSGSCLPKGFLGCFNQVMTSGSSNQATSHGERRVGRHAVRDAHFVAKGGLKPRNGLMDDIVGPPVEVYRKAGSFLLGQSLIYG